MSNKSPSSLFHKNNLLNTFPTNEVFKAIPTLTTLALEGNDVSFSFDDIESPATQFTMIDLTNTKLLSFDGIDEFVPNLTELYAGNNNIADDFPNELLKLTQLRRLDISFNILEGQLPNNIGSSWKNLELLVLHHNKLSGSLPSSLGEMSSLHYLELQSNGFSVSNPSMQNMLFFLVMIVLIILFRHFSGGNSN